MKKLLILFLNLAAAFAAMAQDTAATRKFFVSGYVKDMQTLGFDSSFSNPGWTNLVHNRINVKWKPSDKITAAAEARSRLFYSRAADMPAGAITQRAGNEYFNMQPVWINTRELVFTSNVERLYVDYRTDQIDLRVGRQRINWGMSTTWNPNDIFNSYNFLDFDYEERPGVDGAKFKYGSGGNVSFEVAYARTRLQHGNIAALKLSYNKWNYDFQFISGIYYNKPTLGAGWTGYIGDAGFKGELQYFFAGKDSTGHFNLTMESDYKFAREWYVDFGILYNNYGLSKSITQANAIDLNISPQNLMPAKWNLMLTTTKQFSPRLSANTTLLFAPGTNLFIFFPFIQYNLITNLDVDVIWQSFFAEVNGDFKDMRQIGFLRAKLSF